MIYLPAPEIQTPAPLPLPDVVAVTKPSRPVRLFNPPVDRPASRPLPALPDAPGVEAKRDTAALRLPAAPLRPQPRSFTTPPSPSPPRKEQPALPDAPDVQAKRDAAVLRLPAAPLRPQPRNFTTPPSPSPPRREQPALPDAPDVQPKRDAAALLLPAAPLRPQPRSFTTPPSPPRREQPALPDAPGVQAKRDTAALPLPASPLRPQPRSFTTPPSPPPPRREQPALSDAPDVQPKRDTAALPLPARPLRPQPRSFTTPPSPPPPRREQPALSDAPDVQARRDAAALPRAIPDPRAPLRAFTPPPQPQPAAAPPPALSAAPEATLAIVGLDPVKTPDFPMPPGSRPALFSTGLQLRAEGGESAAGAMIVVPGLLARGGVRDQEPTLVANVPLPPRPSQQALLAAARNALGSAPAAPAPSATRVSGAPDPRLEGRTIYTLAIQMPNVTSYTGSWIVWFAERQLAPGSPALAIAPPIPLRKVDPKYIAAAADERVEGTVRLFAVIRKDGRVDSVALLRHLDDRLDRSAQEALAKWEFTPASRDGAAVEVDAVFEIPFRLKPRSAK